MSTPRVVNVRIVHESVRKYYEDLQPKRNGDSGIDLHVTHKTVIRSGETKKVHLGIAVQAADESDVRGFLLFPRSSICKTPLRLANSVGVIDVGYTGELCAYLDNIKQDPNSYEIQQGASLLQLCSFDGIPLRLRVLGDHEEFRVTERGDGGFGSTN